MRRTTGIALILLGAIGVEICGIVFAALADPNPRIHIPASGHLRVYGRSCERTDIVGRAPDGRTFSVATTETGAL